RDLFAGSLALGALAARSAWTSIPAAAQALNRTAPAGSVPHLTPMRVHADQIADIKVCLRPFRPMGPRLDVEKIGDKTVIHNYGHGGSGWSLSWGSADIAVGK
ncbi:FAD-dependent oxidoreductase, partial [Acetobacter tropicalis]